MANSDAIILNGTGQTVREDIQSNLQALKSNNSTNTTPSGNTLTSYMSWANTGDNQYMVHNGTSFHPILDISSGTSAGTHIAGAGTTAIPGYRFMNNAGSSATQSGMGLPDDGRLGFFMDGSEKISLLSDGKVGIGTTAPSNTFTVLGNQTIYTTNQNAILNISALNSASTDDAFIDFVADTTFTDYGLRVRRNTIFTNNVATFNSEIVSRGAGQLSLVCQDQWNIQVLLLQVVFLLVRYCVKVFVVDKEPPQVPLLLIHITFTGQVKVCRCGLIMLIKVLYR